MYAILGLAFVFLTYSIGDFISVKTKSIVSTMFTCSVIFILAFWMGIPKTLFEDVQLKGIGSLLITILLAHMGTLMSVRQLIEQWKTVLIACAAVVGICALILTVGPILMGRDAAYIAAPVISGGVIASLMMQDAISTASIPNGEMLAVFAVVLMIMEGFVGYPVASFCLTKEGKRIKERIQNGTYVQEAVVETKERKKLIPPIPEKYASENIYFAKVAIVAVLATWISSILPQFEGRSILDKNIISLILGILAHEIGFLEPRILDKANSGGLAMGALLAVIFSSLAGATPENLVKMLPLILIANVLGVVGYAVLAMIVGKLLKVSPWMCIAIGSTANYGFPGTFILSKEVARSLGDTPEMEEKILGAIMPKMLVSGFITVSIASVLMASLVQLMF